MGKKVYIGVNNVPKNVTKIYVGVNGVARKVIKGYVGVNGVAKVFWDGGKIVGGFWFFYETLQNKEFIEFIPDTYSIYTANTGIVFFAMIVAENTSEEALVPLLISTDRDAVTIRSSVGAEYTAAGSVTVNGDTWYWNAWQVFVWKRNYQYSPNCLLKNNVYSWQDSQVVTDLLDRIYTDDFAEDYQVGQTYNYVDADKEKTLRKAFAILLFKNAPWRNSLVYITIMSNIESIIARILSEAQGFKYISFFANPVGIAATQPFANFDIYFGNNNVPDYEVKWVREAFGYKFVEAFGNTRMQTSKRLMIIINGSTISYNVNTNSQEVQRIGIEIQDLHATTSYYGYRVITSNVGIKFN